ncbi:MAG: DsrE/DsrF/TusD sulfur relay family protein [Candidatus Aminicenantales bacterium]
MPKMLTISLFTTPYVFANTHTAVKIAEAALKKGYRVNLFASADGVHNFTLDQKARGIPNAQEEFKNLMERGLNVELCGTCLQFRGIKKDDLMDKAKPSSMGKLCDLIKKSDVFLTLTF